MSSQQQYPHYQHHDYQGQLIALPVGKVICIGQNYLDHIQEMKSKTAPDALFFMKPSTALVPLAPSFLIPATRGSVHNETELAVLIQAPLRKVAPEAVASAIWGYSLALDLTLRDVQGQLKQQIKSQQDVKSLPPHIQDIVNSPIVPTPFENRGGKKRKSRKNRRTKK